MAKASTAPDITTDEPTGTPLPDPNDPNKQTVDIVFRGVTVSIPKRRGRWDIDAIVDFQDGKPLPGLRRLLGANQWQKIKRVASNGDDLDEFSNIAADTINENCVP